MSKEEQHEENNNDTPKF